MRRAAVVAAVTLVAAGVARVLGASWVVVALIVAGGTFVIGVVLWLSCAPAERKLDEIGRTIMVGVVLAVLVGVTQYLLDQRQKERDFNLSLTLQDNLTGADLHNRDLTNVRLQGKILAQADLHDADLSGASLIDTNLSGADLTEADLREADLRGANLDGASLDGADLTRARLKDARLVGASLPRAVLREAELQNAMMSGACLADAKLVGADLGGVEIARAVLTGADVNGAKFESDLRPATGLLSAGLARLKHAANAVWPAEFDPGVADLRLAAAEVYGPDMPEEAVSARVEEVVDGDTLKLEAPIARLDTSGGRAQLIGVDAPDPEDPGGKAAIRFADRTLEGHKVYVQVGSTPEDDGRRVLVHIWRSSDQSFNEEMLAAGYATHRAGDNSELKESLSTAQTAAKQQGAGLWHKCPAPEERISPTSRTR